jgi:hypothetical protein
MTGQAMLLMRSATWISYEEPPVKLSASDRRPSLPVVGTHWSQ